MGVLLVRSKVGGMRISPPNAPHHQHVGIVEMTGPLISSPGSLLAKTNATHAFPTVIDIAGRSPEV